MMHRVRTTLVLAAVAAHVACQSPTSASDVLDVDDFVDAAVSPNPANASTDTGGKTYRVVRGNNQPDEVLPYHYTAVFTVTTSINSSATDDSVDLTFPVTITSASGKVEQASGGIVTPPTGGDTEHYESIILSSSGSTISAVGGSVTTVFQVWYTLPNGRREARLTEAIAMTDKTSSPKSFTKTVYINVSP
ncbi:MAG: hypothetical protein ABI868_10265 [Acidobacteriota bacterium]